MLLEFGGVNALGMPPEGKCSARGVCVMCVSAGEVLEGLERCLCLGEVLVSRRGAQGFGS